MTVGHRVRRAVAAVAVAVTIAVVDTGSALAHGGDPTVVSTLREITPALPDAVAVRVLAADSEVLTVANPTPTPLVVMAPDGSEFLRISAAGVEGNAASRFTSASRYAPLGAPQPAPPAEIAPPRWVRLSDDVSYRWYDPRLHPPAATAPVGGRSDQRSVLASWTIPIRYGNAAAELRGTLDLNPDAGRFTTAVEAAPPGVTALVTEGTPPRMLLQGASGSSVTVLGADGEPFLRRTADGGWEASLGSRTYVDALLARGAAVPAGTGWQRYAAPGPVNWVDDRLGYPEEVTAAARAADGSSEVQQWEIPILVDGRPASITGTTRYAPSVLRTAAASSGLPWIRLGVAGAVVLLAAGAAALTRRRNYTPWAGNGPERNIAS